MNMIQVLIIFTKDDTYNMKATISKESDSISLFIVEPICKENESLSKNVEVDSELTFDNAIDAFKHILEQCKERNYDIEKIDNEYGFPLISKPEQIEIINTFGLNDVVIE